MYQCIVSMKFVLKTTVYYFLKGIYSVSHLQYDQISFLRRIYLSIFNPIFQAGLGILFNLSGDYDKVGFRYKSPLSVTIHLPISFFTKCIEQNTTFYMYSTVYVHCTLYTVQFPRLVYYLLVPAFPELKKIKQNFFSLCNRQS